MEDLAEELRKTNGLLQELVALVSERIRTESDRRERLDKMREELADGRRGLFGPESLKDRMEESRRMIAESRESTKQLQDRTDQYQRERLRLLEEQNTVLRELLEKLLAKS